MTLLKTHKLAILPAITAICMILPFQNSMAIGLKENSIITTDEITLGDIFYDLKRDDGRVLGNAPLPGKDMVLDAKTLLRIAMAMDLSWRPSSNSDKVTLSRAATIIEYEQIEDSIFSALEDEGLYGDYEISIPAQFHKIILPHDQLAEMEITDLNIDSDRKKFEVTIAAPSADNPIQNFQIKGQINTVITVPVLKGNLQYGHVVNKNDIKYIKIKEREFSRDTIADANSLIGMTARRVIIAGRPIKTSEMIAPQVIERGELVTLSFRGGSMNLTTQAKALQNGAKGDTIRVVNTASNKTLQAIVISANEVAVAQY